MHPCSRPIDRVEHDISVFFDAFNESVGLHSDLTSYVRIKPNPNPASTQPSQSQRPRLFEVKASPYYNAQNTDCVCVFAMLAPYPTFNSRRLDAFLPLKAENHLLNDRLAVSSHSLALYSFSFSP